MNQKSSASEVAHPQSKSVSEQLLLNRITNRIRNSLDLYEILSTTVAEVRDYLATDRVEIYQFFPDGHGWVIAEALNADTLPPLKGLHFPVDDIPPYTRELLLQKRQRTVVDVEQRSVFTSYLDESRVGSTWLYTQPTMKAIDPCHLEYLLAMGVQSSVVVPIVLEPSGTTLLGSLDQRPVGKLWGLLISHNAQSREVSTQELDFIQLVVDQVSVAISQSILLEQMREQARLDAEVNRVTALLYTPEKVQLQQALNETVDVYQGSGGRLYLFALTEQQQPTVYETGEQPTLLPSDTVYHPLRPVEEHQIWRRYLTSTITKEVSAESVKPWSVSWMQATYAHESTAEKNKGSVKSWAIADIYKEPLLRSVAPHFQNTNVRGMLICPLHYGGSLVGCLTIFRDEIEQEIAWAGYHAPDKRQLAPRQSFDVWRQLKQGTSQEWTQMEIRLIQSLGERFSVAVKQYQLNQQIQSLNSNLEQQVTIRTAELQHSTAIANQQRTLAAILAKLQKPLEMRDLFKAASKEMQQLLQVDRVAVYRFDPDWGGEFVDEFGTVSVGWQDLILATRKTWNDSYLQETQGAQYKDGKVSVVHDIHHAELSPCHIEILEHYYVQAYMIAPLFVDQRLWGLIGAYQHERARTWEDSEVAFISQLATHLGVALQQSQSIEKVRLQASELAAAAKQQEILNQVIQKIRDSLDLETIFTTATQELRKLLKVERVAIFKFLPSQELRAGKVVAENVHADYPSALEMVIEEPCFLHDKYKSKELIYYIDDVEKSEIQSCYRDMLRKFKVRANLVAPLFDGDQLWGLVCIHQCSGPRSWKEKEKELTHQIATQFGVAIQQAKFLSDAESARQIADFSSQAKSRFLATMSHELRTPLNAILGTAQLLNRDKSLTRQQHQRLNTIGQSGEHLLSLINSVLEISRIESGETQLEEKVVYLPAFFSTLEDMLENTARSKGINLTIKLAPDLPEYILVDEGKLRQILINLLGNSLKFTEQGFVILQCSVQCGHGTWGLESEFQRVLMNFSVQDTGPGIAPRELGNIFEAFSQAHAGLESHEGTGLGLSICRQFVDLMGGEISVDSEVGVGSIFYFSIQASRATSPSHKKPTDIDEIVCLASGQPIPRLLVVEDKAASRTLLVDLLVSVGFDVQEAVNGKDAIHVWQDCSPDLIWMDMHMPVMDGYSATREIKRLAQENPPVIVALTANAFEEDRKVALEAGCDDFVRKPFRAQELLELLTRHLGVHYQYINHENPESQLLKIEEYKQEQGVTSVDAKSELWSSNSHDESAALKILVAENEESNQQLMQDMLDYCGHQVHIVSDGREAVEACQMETYDLLMLDFQMPGLTGPEAAHQIRATYGTQEQPLIVGVTGHSIPEGSNEFCESGMDQILQKPVSLERLEAFFSSFTQIRNSIKTAKQTEQPSPAVLDRRFFYRTCHQLYGEQAPQKIIEQIDKFLNDWPEQMGALELAIAAQDREQVFQLAHDLKVLAANLGGTELSDVLERLEILSRRDEMPDYQNLPASLVLESQRLKLALVQERQRYQEQIDKMANQSCGLAQ